MEKKDSIFSEKEIITELIILVLLPFSVLFFAQFKGFLFLPFAVISLCIVLRLFILIKKMKNQKAKIAPDFDTMINSLKNMDFTYRSSDEEYYEILKLNELSKAISDKMSKLKSNLHLKTDDINLTINEAKKEIEDSVIKLSSSINLSKYDFDTKDLQLIIDDSLTLNQEVLSSSEEIAQSIDSLYSSIDEVSAIVEETSQSIQVVTNNAENLLSSTEETAAAMIELSSNAKQSVSNAQETAQVAQKMKLAAQDGNKSVQESVEGIKELRKTVLNAVDTIDNLGNSAKKIGDIVKVIRDIAEQTNLLALNAAIEAARAGEHGRGFAVVADEVRKLAERSRQSTKQISALIKNIQNETFSAVEAVKNGAQSAENVTNLAQQAGEKINQVLDGVEETTHFVEKIALSSIDQSGVSDIVSESITSMNSQALQVSQAIKEQSIGVKHIVDALTHIKNMMGQIQSSISLQVSGNMNINDITDRSKEVMSKLNETIDFSNNNNLSKDFKENISNLAENINLTLNKIETQVQNFETNLKNINHEFNKIKSK
ncbi:MAG: methyl-accepting chemotaxis protein [Candidatus Sericytochromatia bacterium]